MASFDNEKCGPTALSLLHDIEVPIHRIIPFSNVEGKGNRTSIFLQGCKLNCLYCHNPETIPRYSDDAKNVSLFYLYEQVKDSMPFIRGVTFSGGEPTIHNLKLIPLMKAIKELGLTIYMDSSGFFEFERHKQLIEHTDKFLFDLKGMGAGLKNLCLDRGNKLGIVPKSTFSKANELISMKATLRDRNLSRNLSNLEQLVALDKVEEVRLVVINGFFDAYELICEVAQRIKDSENITLKLIRVHSKGTRDVKGIDLCTPSKDEIDHLSNYARECGIQKIVNIY